MSRAFRLAVAVSLLLFAATLAMWLRSYWRDDAAAYIRNDPVKLHRRGWGVESELGEVSFWSTYTDYTVTSRAMKVAKRQMPKAGWSFMSQGANDFEWRAVFPWIRLLFGHSMTELDTLSLVAVPYWAFAAGFLALPLIWLIRRRRTGRLPGHCGVCGYDLRASTERCPECGAVRDQGQMDPPSR